MGAAGGPTGLALVDPTVRLRDSWLRARAEWGGVRQDGAGLHDEDDVGSVAGFTAWVRRLRAETDDARARSAGRVPASYWWVVAGEDYLGAITLRHRVEGFTARVSGHVGYGVRPSARGRGVASWALARVLERAPGFGLDRLLLTCLDGNVASARVIERAGGVLEGVVGTEFGPLRRYWVAVPGPGASSRASRSSNQPSR